MSGALDTTRGGTSHLSRSTRGTDHQVATIGSMPMRHIAVSVTKDIEDYHDPTVEDLTHTIRVDQQHRERDKKPKQDDSERSSSYSEPNAV